MDDERRCRVREWMCGGIEEVDAAIVPKQQLKYINHLLLIANNGHSLSLCIFVNPCKNNSLSMSPAGLRVGPSSLHQ